jgi:hypothetical protein
MAKVRLKLNGSTEECVRTVYYIDGEPRVQFAPADAWRLNDDGTCESIAPNRGMGGVCATWVPEEPNYGGPNICPVCKEPQLGVHYHEAPEEEEGV